MRLINIANITNIIKLINDKIDTHDIIKYLKSLKFSTDIHISGVLINALKKYVKDDIIGIIISKSPNIEYIIIVSKRLYLEVTISHFEIITHRGKYYFRIAYPSYIYIPAYIDNNASIYYCNTTIDKEQQILEFNNYSYVRIVLSDVVYKSLGRPIVNRAMSNNIFVLLEHRQNKVIVHMFISNSSRLKRIIDIYKSNIPESVKHNTIINYMLLWG